MAIYYEDINLELNTNTAYIVVGAKQGDSARGIRAHLFRNGNIENISSGYSAEYRIHKPDGTSVWNKASINNNAVEIELTANSLAASGRGYADIILTSQEGTISTTSFILLIQASPDITTNLKSSDEFEAIQNTVENAKKVINESEAWAVGTRGGQAVIANDFTYRVITGGQFLPTGSINENTFRAKVGQFPGEIKNYNFVYSSGDGWHLNNGFSPVSLNEYGITIDSTITIGNNDEFQVTVQDKDDTYNNNAKYYKNRAEAWAIGEIDGEIVDIGDETYNNNAKYWAEEAEARSNEFDEKFINTSEWNNATVYNKLSVVAYYGNTYLSKVDNNIGHEPPRPSDQEQSGVPFIPIESNYWILLAARGKKGDTGSITDFEINSGTGINVNKVEGVYKYTVNHSNNITASSSEKLRSFTYDAQGHITSASVVTLSASDVGAIAAPVSPSNGQILSYNNGWIASGLPNNIVTSNAIAQSAVVSSAIAQSAVTNAKISSMDASKLTGNIASARITAVNASAITGTLAAGNIPNLDASKITSGTFGSARIATSAILSAQISASAITAAKISASAVTEAKISASAVTSEKIAYGAIVSKKTFRLLSGEWAENTYGTYTGVFTISDLDPAKHIGFLTNQRQIVYPGSGDWGFSLDYMEKDEQEMSNIFSAAISSENTLTMTAKVMPTRNLYMLLEVSHI